MTTDDLLRLCIPYVPDDIAAQIQIALQTTKRATRLPAGWRPDTLLLTWAKAERPDVDPVKQVGAFCDYWQSKAGKDGCKLSWDATFRNWIRNCRSDPKVFHPPERVVSPQVVAQRKRAEPVPDSPKVRDLLAEFAAKMRINVG